MGLSRCFPLGRLLTTPGANGLDWMPVLAKKHAWGDWGKVCRSDREANDMNWRAGYGRLFSAYRLDSGEDVWIITEADRSATTVLLPWEY
ncbi:hypothetical protein D6833_13935 [Candidatus Parcubacteria bacterium]|nr:MAG: hypothetical protein D6833_13935 [Candidatus Parcubacteria bacterium]